MRRPSVATLVLAWLLSMFVYSLAAKTLTVTDFNVVATVVDVSTPDTRGMRVYQLRFGPDHGTVTVMADGDLPFAQLLNRAGKVRVVLEPVSGGQLERLER